MSATFDSEPARAEPQARFSAEPQARFSADPAPAAHPAIAARRLSWAEAGLTVLALISFGLVFTRLYERWRVTPGVVSHRIAIFGHELSYPVANLAAVLVLALAVLGGIVVAIMIASAIRELRATRRFVPRLQAGRPGVVKDAFVLDDPRPRAFCVGFLRPRVYVTSGALAILDEKALEAVLRHERHHARRRDPLRLAASRVLASGLFFLPGLDELGRRREALGEISADLAAIRQAQTDRSALARAMLSFGDSAAVEGSVGIDPLRIDHLLGEPPSWRFPTLLVLVATALLALLAAVAVLVGQEAAGSASLAPPFLSAQPCVVVLALIPAGIGLTLISVVRLRRARKALPTAFD